MWADKLLENIGEPVVIFGLDESSHMYFPVGGVKAHRHYCHEIEYLIECRGMFTVNDVNYAVKDNDIFIVNPGEMHASRITSRGAKSMMIKFTFRGSNTMPHFPNHANLHSFPEELSHELRQLLHRACVEAHKPVGDFRLSRATFTAFLLLLLRSLKEIDRLTSSTTGTCDCEKLHEYIKQNYNLHISLSDLSRMTGLNPEYICRKFSDTIGISPMAALTHARIEVAKEYLTGSVMPIKDIAERIGYTDVHHFSKRFKQIAGISPERFRKSNCT